MHGGKKSFVVSTFYFSLLFITTRDKKIDAEPLRIYKSTACNNLAANAGKLAMFHQLTSSLALGAGISRHPS